MANSKVFSSIALPAFRRNNRSLGAALIKVANFRNYSDHSLAFLGVDHITVQPPDCSRMGCLSARRFKVILGVKGALTLLAFFKRRGLIRGLLILRGYRLVVRYLALMLALERVIALA